MFKSIVTLDLSADGRILFYTLPLDILFDSNESQLENIKLNHWWQTPYRGGNYSIYLCNKFETKYINLKNKFDQQGKNTTVLKCLVQNNHLTNRYISAFKYIESKYIVLKSTTIDLFVWNSNVHVDSRLRMISFEHESHVSSNCKSVSNLNNNKSIDTLRFIDIDISRNISTNIFNNEILIEALNFHNSVKNMTISVKIPSTFGFKFNDWSWSKTISNLLVKKNFFHLTNLNVLITVNLDQTESSASDWLFTILKQHQKLLKHQFEHLNIAIQIVQNGTCKRCCTIEWNSTIDDGWLDFLHLGCKY